MTVRRKRLFIGGGAAILVGAFIVILAISRSTSQARSPTEELDGVLRESNDHLAEMVNVPAQDGPALVQFFRSAPALLDAQVEEAAAAGAPALTDAARDALHQTLVDFVRLRAQADAEAYTAWMRARGAALRPLREAEGLPKFKQRMFSIHAGREQTPDDTPWTMFRDAFEGDLAHGRAGVTRPKSVAAGEHAAKVLIGVMREPGDISHAFVQVMSDLLVSTPFPEDMQRFEWSEEWAPLIWWMGQGHPGRSYWRPATDLEQVIERDGRALVVEAHLALVTEAGDALPTRIFLYYDPQANRWHIDGVSYVNTYAVTLGAGPAY